MGMTECLPATRPEREFLSGMKTSSIRFARLSIGLSFYSFALVGLNSGANGVVVNVPPFRNGGFYAVADVGRVPTERCFRPTSRMNFADAVSRSSLHPHSQECHRSSSVFLRIVPQFGQVCDVLDGSTKRTVRPALAALTLVIFMNMPHPASRILLFSPAFALAPFGRYFPVASSCLGCGALTRWAIGRSSKTITWKRLTSLRDCLCRKSRRWLRILR
jgi:hypothetical protein